MPDIEIIGLPQSNFVWAARIALAQKGVAHTCITAPPHSPAVLAIHPLGKIPVLRHGEVTVAESRAIIDYADRVFDGPALAPSDPKAAAVVDTWTSMIVTTMEPLLVRQYLFAYFFPKGPGGVPDRETIDALVPKVERHLDVLEAALERGDIGGTFTRVDAYLVPILFYLRNTPEGGPALFARPQLTAYLDERLAHPSVTTTMPPPPGA